MRLIQKDCTFKCRKDIFLLNRGKWLILTLSRTSLGIVKRSMMFLRVFLNKKKILIFFIHKFYLS